MRLDRIEIQNFKGVGQLQTLKFKPITLLFGPNSAGKSTILQALHYLREILERGNTDPDVTIAGGLIDLGGFATLVHNHELDRKVQINVTFDLSEDQDIEALPINSGAYAGNPEFVELPLRYLLGESTEFQDYAVVQTICLELLIEWSELEQASYVSRLGVKLDDEHIAAVVSSPQEGRATLTDFNFAHPLLRRAIEPGGENDEADLSSPLEDEVWNLAREVALDRSSPDTPDDKLRIAVDTENGALPDLDRELNLDIRDPDVKKVELEQNTPRANGLRRLLSELVLGPTRLVRDYLSEMTYIGPLREIPTRGYRPQATPDESRWAHGLAAWDLLYEDAKGELIDEVNGWLADENRLNTGYRVERVDFKEVPIPSRFHHVFERGLSDDDIGEIQELYFSLQIRSEIALRDFQRGILVAPGDVGVGISQMLPVVIAALRRANGILAIEQPELHIHPAIQVGLGDLFIHSTSGDPNSTFASNSLIIETHSEHIMLRLLRRIREEYEDELPPGVQGLGPDDLCVIYVESDADGVRFVPLEVSKDGDFLDRWPQGFFDERAEELF